MREIKMKEDNHLPKMKDSAIRLPKESAKTATLEAKEKSHQIAENVSEKEGRESPVEYASEKIASTEEWMAGMGVSGASAAGRKMMKKSYEKMRERKKARQTTIERAEGTERNGPAVESISPAEKAGIDSDKFKTGKSMERTVDTQKIKMKPERKTYLHSANGRIVKTAPRIVKGSTVPSDKIRAERIVLQKQQTGFARRMTGQMPTKSANAVRTVKKTGIRYGEKAARLTGKGIQAAFKTVISAAKSLWALYAGGIGIVILLVVMLGVIGGFLLNNNSQSAEPLSPEVLNYTPVIQRYAEEYGIPEYVQVIQAIMMQESGGRGNDPMQASQSPYNADYPRRITDPEYSIQVGVQTYAACVREAGCTSPQDMDRLKLSLQGYNYGNGYISWAIQNFGGYSEANALQFSQEQAAVRGWLRYGDPEYVPHVLRYYAGGNLFAGLFGNSEMVSVSLSQLGNEGGQKFWSWYGFSGRVEWCACFVSWCAEQSGLLANGTVPRFSLCSDGMNWFQSRGKWQGNSYQPSAGTVIFFDWNGDGNPDHVGIVEKCENGRVYTVEGNSSDAVRQRNYAVGARTILGYGIIRDI